MTRARITSAALGLRLSFGFPRAPPPLAFELVGAGLDDDIGVALPLADVGVLGELPVRLFAGRALRSSRWRVRPRPAVGVVVVDDEGVLEGDLLLPEPLRVLPAPLRVVTGLGWGVRALVFLVVAASFPRGCGDGGADRLRPTGEYLERPRGEILPAWLPGDLGERADLGELGAFGELGDLGDGGESFSVDAVDL